MQLQQPFEIYGHIFDEATGLYLLPVRLYPEADGSCPLPENTVDFPPSTPLDAHQAWRINAARTDWDVVADFRNVMLWDIRTGEPVLNTLALDELPSATVTVQAPLPLAPLQRATNRWNSDVQAWELIPDYSQVAIWDKASGQVLPMLEVGLQLPATATDQAPPRNLPGPWQFNETLGGWESVPTPAAQMQSETPSLPEAS